jgi:hypothetical protein
MDPITLKKLLSIVDALEQRREDDQIDASTFARVVAEQTQAKHKKRRERDIRRILEASGWVEPEAERLHLTQHYFDFISAWNEGDLIQLNNRLADYPPYRRFLICLQQEGVLPVPARDDKETKSRLGRRLKKQHNLTFVAFNTFRRWAVAVGQAYLSPFEGSIYWGGNWSKNSPLLETFRARCREAYLEAEKTSGYASIGRLVDTVCRAMHISFQAFEIKMNGLLKEQPRLVKLARATIRQPSSGHEITTVRPRSEVLRGRLAAKLLDESFSAQPQWLERRYLEDGIRLNGKLVKLIRWEESP